MIKNVVYHAHYVLFFRVYYSVASGLSTMSQYPLLFFKVIVMKHTEQIGVYDVQPSSSPLK